MREIKSAYNEVDKISELQKELNYLETRYINAIYGLDINSKKVSPNKKFR